MNASLTLDRPVRAGSACSIDELTPRELQMLDGICRGLSNLEIAAELFLSINSVKTYIRTAYRKIGVRTRAQAVAWGLTHGVLDRTAAVPADRLTLAGA